MKKVRSASAERRRLRMIPVGWSGKDRSWPYGTKKRVRVIEVAKSFAICKEDITNEAFVLLGVPLRGVELGADREIVYSEGGPLGGYWDFVRIDCVASGATTPQEIVDALIARVAEVEAARGVSIDWIGQLPTGRQEYTARDIVNAIGRALTEAGIENNFERYPVVD